MSAANSTTTVNPPVKKRIAIISSSFSPYGGGVSSAHYNLYRLLQQRGHTVRMFTNDDPDGSPHPDAVKRRTPVLIKRILRYCMSLYFRYHGDTEYRRQLHYILNSAWSSWMLRGPVRRFAPQIMIVPDVSSPLTFIGKPAGCRVFFYSHHNPMRFVGNPLIRKHSVRDAEAAVAIEQKGLRHADAVLCASAYMKDVFLRTYPSVPASKVTLLPIPVDESLISTVPAASVAQRLGVKEPAFTVYIPSAGSDIKGGRYTFEIVRRLTTACSQQGTTVCFYLSGPITEELRYELDHWSGASMVLAPGKLPYEQNLALVKSCSFMVSPTLLDSYGMAQLEALMCGLPVVTFDVGGNRDMLEQGVTGYLVPFLDVEQLIARAQELCGAERLETMRDAVRRSPMTEFRAEHVLSRLEQEMAG